MSSPNENESCMNHDHSLGQHVSPKLQTVSRHKHCRRQYHVDDLVLTTTLTTLPPQLLFIISTYLFNSIDAEEPCLAREHWITTCTCFRDIIFTFERPIRLTCAEGTPWGDILSRLATLSTSSSSNELTLRVCYTYVPALPFSLPFPPIVQCLRHLTFTRCHLSTASYWAILTTCSILESLYINECTLTLLDYKYNMPMTDPVTAQSHSRACSFLRQIVEEPTFPTTMKKIHFQYPGMEWMSVHDSQSSDNPFAPCPISPGNMRDLSQFQISLQDTDGLGSLLQYACLRQSFSNFHTVGFVYAHATMESLVTHHGFSDRMPSFLHGPTFFSKFVDAMTPPPTSPLFIVSKMFGGPQHCWEHHPLTLFLVDRVDSVDYQELRQLVRLTKTGQVDGAIKVGERLMLAIREVI